MFHRRNVPIKRLKHRSTRYTVISSQLVYPPAPWCTECVALLCTRGVRTLSWSSVSLIVYALAHTGCRDPVVVLSQFTLWCTEGVGALAHTGCRDPVVVLSHFTLWCTEGVGALAHTGCRDPVVVLSQFTLWCTEGVGALTHTGCRDPVVVLSQFTLWCTEGGGTLTHTGCQGRCRQVVSTRESLRSVSLQLHHRQFVASSPSGRRRPQNRQWYRNYNGYLMNCITYRKEPVDYCWDIAGSSLWRLGLVGPALSNPVTKTCTFYFLVVQDYSLMAS